MLNALRLVDVVRGAWTVATVESGIAYCFSHRMINTSHMRMRGHRIPTMWVATRTM